MVKNIIIIHFYYDIIIELFYNKLYHNNIIMNSSTKTLIIYAGIIFVILIIVLTSYIKLNPFNSSENYDNKFHKFHKFPQNYFRIIDRETNKCITINPIKEKNNMNLLTLDFVNDTKDQLFIGTNDGKLLSINGSFMIIDSHVKHDGIPVYMSDNLKKDIKLCQWDINEHGNIYNMKNKGYLSISTTTSNICINHSIPKNWYLRLEESDSPSASNPSTSTSDPSPYPASSSNMNIVVDPVVLDLLKCKSEFKIKKHNIEGFTSGSTDPISSDPSSIPSTSTSTSTSPSIPATDDDRYNIKYHRDYDKLMSKLMFRDDCSLAKGASLENHPDYHKYMALYAVRDPTVSYPIKYMPIDDYNKYILGVMSKREDGLKKKILRLNNQLESIKNSQTDPYTGDCRKHFTD